MGDGGIDFVVRVIEGGRRELRRAGGDPFLPYEEELYVGDVWATHVCLLNKYPVVQDHLLFATRAFEAQETLLSPADWEALERGLAEFDGLAFYNSGPTAGASQRHKHLQQVTLPLGPGGAPLPIAPWISEARALPFRHALGRLTAGDPGARHALYRALLSELGLERGERTLPYNLLATREWLLVVPRSACAAHGVEVNALGFAGSLVCRDAAQRDAVARHGPVAILQAVTPVPPRPQ